MTESIAETFLQFLKEEVRKDKISKAKQTQKDIRYLEKTRFGRFNGKMVK